MWASFLYDFHESCSGPSPLVFVLIKYYVMLYKNNVSCSPLPHPLSLLLLSYYYYVVVMRFRFHHKLLQNGFWGRHKTSQNPTAGIFRGCGYCYLTFPVLFVLIYSEIASISTMFGNWNLRTAVLNQLVSHKQKLLLKNHLNDHWLKHQFDLKLLLK